MANPLIFFIDSSLELGKQGSEKASDMIHSSANISVGLCRGYFYLPLKYIARVTK
ncbi:hypothetical protein PROVRUST_07597 [Providencia rustigianii DSM 4541]|uniref:Uncharacterized protein n=1 Tax=Providencia rustigianii DSM 4541 TaxID=500637 RepID=D1P5T8_9GAMM|nr:hypothetical protein PROVRUST_07597 [Providencia rustigianii DSM 4541]